MDAIEQRRRAVEILREYQALRSSEIDQRESARRLDDMLERLADLYDVKPALTYAQNAQLQDLLSSWAAANLQDGDPVWAAFESVIENVQETLPAQDTPVHKEARSRVVGPEHAHVRLLAGPWAERIAGEIQIHNLTLAQHAIIVNGLSSLLPNANAAMLLDAIKEVSS